MKCLTPIFIFVSVTSSATLMNMFSSVNQTDINEVQPAESYSYYKSMMMSVLDKRNHSRSTLEDEESATSYPIPPAPKVIKTVKEAFATLLEVAVKGIFEGMFPHIERQRREAIEDRKTIIDVVLNFFGALVGRQQCSEILACRYVLIYFTFPVSNSKSCSELASLLAIKCLERGL